MARRRELTPIKHGASARAHAKQAWSVGASNNPCKRRPPLSVSASSSKAAMLERRLDPPRTRNAVSVRANALFSKRCEPASAQALGMELSDPPLASDIRGY